MLGPCIAPEVLHLLKERFVVGQVRPHHNPRKLFRTPKIPHRGNLRGCRKREEWPVHEPFVNIDAKNPVQNFNIVRTRDSFCTRMVMVKHVVGPLRRTGVNGDPVPGTHNEMDVQLKETNAGIVLTSLRWPLQRGCPNRKHAKRFARSLIKALKAPCLKGAWRLCTCKPVCKLICGWLGCVKSWFREGAILGGMLKSSGMNIAKNLSLHLLAVLRKELSPLFR